MTKSASSGNKKPTAKPAQSIQPVQAAVIPSPSEKPLITPVATAKSSKPTGTSKPPKADSVAPSAASTASPKTSPADPGKKAEKSKAKANAALKPVEPLKEKPKKPKLVRDSFTMPAPEYQVLADMKKACLKAGIDVKKSELLRVGVFLLKKLNIDGVKEVLSELAPLKAGRPKKEK